MTENYKKLITPVKLEFNLDQTIQSFDLLESMNEITKLLLIEDETIKFTNTEQTATLYELGLELPQGQDFQNNFKVRELTFRKGNRKVILYFTIESTLPINRIKFTEPIKKHLQENNIWLKPDLFLTKIESSPGFLTLIHPRMTNKIDL